MRSWSNGSKVVASWPNVDAAAPSSRRRQYRLVLPHGELERLAENLWWTWGSTPRGSLRRAMVVARLRSGRLVIHAPITLDGRGMDRLEALGRPAYVVVPNVGHRLDALAYKERFPKTQVFAPRGAREEIDEVVPVDGIYEDFPPDPDVRLETLHGVGDTGGAMIVRSEDGVTVVLDDAALAVDPRRDPLGFLFATVLGPRPTPRVSRLVRLLFTKNRRALREDLERFADDPDLVRLVAHQAVARGGAVTRGEAASQALRKAATQL